MATVVLDSPGAFMDAIRVVIPSIMLNAFRAHSDKDREQFTRGAFNTFNELGGARILKQLVDIKRDTRHELHGDEECADILAQDWLLFITQIMNFGRACPHNTLITDVEQKEHDDGGVQFLDSTDFHIFHEVMGVRNYPKDSDPFLSIAMDIRHDFVNLVLKHFVMATCPYTSSLRELVEDRHRLHCENLQLKHALAEYERSTV
jgi:hypothetical protein